MRNSRNAFTLVELTLAMVVMAVVALAIATVTVTLGKAYENTSDFYDALQTGRTASIRLQQLLNEARLVTVAGNDSMILWVKDSNEDSQINLDELAIVSYDAGDQQIIKQQVVFPGTMSEGEKAIWNSEISLDFAMNEKKISRQIQRSSYWESQTMATGVTGFTLLTDVVPPLSLLVTFEITVGSGESQVITRGSGALRVPMTDKVGIVGHNYVLSD